MTNPELMLGVRLDFGRMINTIIVPKTIKATDVFKWRRGSEPLLTFITRARNLVAREGGKYWESAVKEYKVAMREKAPSLRKMAQPSKHTMSTRTRIRVKVPKVSEDQEKVASLK
jgi:hypothetical protein